MSLERLRLAVAGGMSILVGSVDPSGMPACCRGVALTADDDLSSVIVYVPVATSHETVQNVASTRRIAVVASHPIDHNSVQIKGEATQVRIAGDDEAELVSDQIEKWAETLGRIGLPRRITRRLAQWPAFAIEVRVEETFDQTPGPKAGNRIG